MSKVFFTSDLHIGHYNCIGFDDRPFRDTEEMENELIRRWNEKVPKDGVVYVLGDMIWRHDDVPSLLKKLNGQINIVTGNHDKFLSNGTNKKAFNGISDYSKISVTLNNGETKKVVLSHYLMPFYDGHYHGGIHLYGHFHKTPEHDVALKMIRDLNNNGYECNAYNVGCMFYDYAPVTLDEIIDKWSTDKRYLKRLFFDFDGTLNDTFKTVVGMYNKDFDTDIDPNIVVSWDFEEVNCKMETIKGYFNDDRFFNKENMHFFENSEEVINKLYDDGYEINFVTIGTDKNLKGKSELLGRIFPYANLILLDENKYKDKSSINMMNGIFIDDLGSNLKTSNADVDICFGKKYAFNSDWDGIRCESYDDLYTTIKGIK